MSVDMIGLYHYLIILPDPRLFFSSLFYPDKAVIFPTRKFLGTKLKAPSFVKIIVHIYIYVYVYMYFMLYLIGFRMPFVNENNLRRTKSVSGHIVTYKVKRTLAYGRNYLYLSHIYIYIYIYI